METVLPKRTADFCFESAVIQCGDDIRISMPVRVHFENKPYSGRFRLVDLVGFVRADVIPKRGDAAGMQAAISIFF